MTRKLNKKKEKDNNIQPVSQEEFDKVIKALLNSPPRKKRKERKQFKIVYNHQNIFYILGVKIYIDIEIDFIVKKSNKLNIIIEGFEVPLVENTTAWILRKLLDAKLKFTGKVYLPTKREKVTVLRSPHKHKDSQEQFEKRIHHRIIHIFNPSPGDLESLSKLQVPHTVGLELRNFS